MIELADLKSYLRVDSDDDDALIMELEHAAEDYLASAGVAPDSDDSRYRLAVKSLVLHYYDNRAPADIPRGVRQLIVQLREG